MQGLRLREVLQHIHRLSRGRDLFSGTKNLLQLVIVQCKQKAQARFWHAAFSGSTIFSSFTSKDLSLYLTRLLLLLHLALNLLSLPLVFIK